MCGYEIKSVKDGALSSVQHLGHFGTVLEEEVGTKPLGQYWGQECTRQQRVKFIPTTDSGKAVESGKVVHIPSFPGQNERMAGKSTDITLRGAIRRDYAVSRAFTFHADGLGSIPVTSYGPPSPVRPNCRARS